MHKDEVSPGCSSEVFIRQENAADDFRLDKELYNACQVRLPARLRHCTALHWPALSWGLLHDLNVGEAYQEWGACRLRRCTALVSFMLGVVAWA